MVVPGVLPAFVLNMSSQAIAATQNSLSEAADNTDSGSNQHSHKEINLTTSTIWWFRGTMTTGLIMMTGLMLAQFALDY